MSFTKESSALDLNGARTAMSGRFSDVLAAAKNGEEWAWEAIYREFSGPVTGYLVSRGAADAEGLTGEVLLNVARGIHGFDGDSKKFRSWIFVITHRCLIDDRRMRARRPISAELSEAYGGDVEDEAIDRLARDDLERLFEGLTVRQRDVLSLRIIGGLSLRDTAEVLDMQVGAVKVMQHRAIATLRDRLMREDVTL
jgi:RNA polymerase sigma-70 factor (ECF subfamily)